MMGAGYTGGIRIPDIRIKEKFAWLPILTTSGKWVWWRKYLPEKDLLQMQYFILKESGCWRR